MMGARPSSSDLAMQMQASMNANRPNDLAMAQQLQLQAYQKILNGRNGMPPRR